MLATRGPAGEVAAPVALEEVRLALVRDWTSTRAGSSAPRRADFDCQRVNQLELRGAQVDAPFCRTGSSCQTGSCERSSCLCRLSH